MRARRPLFLARRTSHLFLNQLDARRVTRDKKEPPAMRAGGSFINNEVVPGSEGLIRMQGFCLSQQLLLGFDMIRIIDTTIDRAYRNALLVVVKSDALGALVGNDVVELIGKGGMILPVQFVLLAAGIDRCIGALGFTSATVDAFFIDH